MARPMGSAIRVPVTTRDCNWLEHKRIGGVARQATGAGVTFQARAKPSGRSSSAGRVRQETFGIAEIVAGKPLRVVVQVVRR